MKDRAAVLVTVFAIAACGGKPPPPPAPPPANGAGGGDDKLIRPITQAQVKVAHFASPDGTLGLVLDRSVDPPRVRFDGKPDTIEITMVEDRRFGERSGFFLKSPDGKNQLYIGVHGDVRTWVGGTEVVLNSDHPADALPAPTVKGQYVAPKSPREIAEAKLAPFSVMLKWPDYKPEDSGDVAKIGEVVAKADPSLFVHIAQNGSEKARWAPASALIGNVHQGLGGQLGGWPRNEPWSPTAKGFAKYGGVLVPQTIEFGSGNRLHMGVLKGWPAPLAVGTPGLVWQIDSGTVIFVTLDGGRYEIPIDDTDTKGLPVTPGLGPAESWPPPLQHALMDVESIRALAKAGVISKQAGADIEAVDDLWFSCVGDVWKKTKDKLDKIQATHATANEMVGNLAATEKAAVLSVPKVCGPAETKLDAALVKFIEARSKERQALYTAAQARLASAAK